MSLAIEHEIVDTDITRRFFRGMLIEFWHLSEGFIEARRAARSNSRLLCELEWLFEKWKI
jgi:Domain of unknown function (DUF4760)